MKNKTCTVITAVLLLGLIASNSGASIVYGVGDSGNTNEASSVTSWETVIDGNGTANLLTDIDGIADGEAFKYSIKLIPVGGITVFSEAEDSLRNGNPDGWFSDGQGVTIQVAVTAGMVQFDGFTWLIGNRCAGGNDNEGFDVNGTIYANSALGADVEGIADGVSLVDKPESAFTALAWHNDEGASVSLRTVETQFSAIPEPTTLGLLGIFGLVYLLRRKLNS